MLTLFGSQWLEVFLVALCNITYVQPSKIKPMLSKLFCRNDCITKRLLQNNPLLVSLASFVLFLLIFVDCGEFGTILVICDEIFFYTWFL